MNDKTNQMGEPAAPVKDKQPSNYMNTGMDHGDSALTSDITGGEGITHQGASPVLDVTSGQIEGQHEERIDLTDDEKLALEETEAEAEVTAETDTTPALPEFDAAVPATVEAYDKAFKPDGKLNLKALGQQWFKNAGGTDDAALAKGKLDDGTRKYLNSIGIDDETIKEVSDAQVAKIKSESGAATAQVVAIAGSAEVLEDALKWGGKDGGYTKAQIERFNRDYKGTDPEARADAVEALMARYNKANPKGRRASPKVTTQGGGNAPDNADPAAKGGTYANSEEHRKEFNEAREAKDPKKIAEVRAKLARSTFWRKQRG